jgi:MFS transporter, DHA1 family, multidrug resistance protein
MRRRRHLPADYFHVICEGVMPVVDSFALRVLLTSLAAFGPLSTDLYLPSLPVLVQAFDSDVSTVQLTLSVFMAGFAASQLIYGPLSDRFGRRPVILIGLVLFFIASIACAYASSIEQLIGARFLQALGGCVGPVVGRAVVRDVFGRDRAASVLAYMATAMAVAPAVGPLLGGVLTEHVGWRANFVLLAGLAVTVFIGAWRLLEESNVHRDENALKPTRLLGNYMILLRDRAYLGFALTTTLVFAGMFSFISGSSFLLVTELGLSPTAYGLCFGVVVAGFMSGSFIAGRLSARAGGVRMIRIGATLAAMGGLIAVGLSLSGVLHVAAIIAPMALYIFGAGLAMPNAMAGAVANYPTMAGLASSLVGFVQMTCAAAAGAAVGALHDGGSLALTGALALAGGGAAAAAWGLVGRARVRGAADN